MYDLSWEQTEPNIYVAKDAENNIWWECYFKSSFGIENCIELRHYYNEPLNSLKRDSEDQEYIHICDLNEYIDFLKKLKDKLDNSKLEEQK